MSIKTWKKEFYPKRPLKKMTKREAIEHSIRKWEGLRKSNLKRHGVSKSSYLNAIENKDDYRYFLNIDTSSCALCVKYLDQRAFTEEYACGKCPLYQSLGASCDHDNQSPYQVWVDTDNPAKMIKALRKLL